MAILTNSGRAAVAASVKSQTIHMAWGSGSASWDTTPVPEPIDATALVAELGRRKVTQSLFCLPDPNGELVTPQGRFTASTDPTKYLYMRFSFDFSDAAASTIREVAVFIGTKVKASVPAGKDYVVPADLDSPGQMLVLERIPKLERSSSIRQQFEFVIQL